MKTVKYNVIGLMSGTSCDGLDIANCIFWKDKRKWFYEINSTKTINYNALNNNIYYYYIYTVPGIYYSNALYYRNPEVIYSKF